MKADDVVDRQVPSDTLPQSQGLFDGEEKLPLTTAAKIAFSSRRSRPPSRATLFRWIRKGKLGIKLESRRFNGNFQTSVEAILRFIDRVDRAAESRSTRIARRSIELDRVARKLDELGL